MASEMETMVISPGSNGKMEIDLEKMRKMIKNYIEKQHYLAAEFWANKLVSLSGGAYIDVYLLAQCYSLTKQYHRAIVLITSHNLIRNSTCRYLAANCHYHVGEYQMAIDILDGIKGANGFMRKNESSPLAIPEIDDTSSSIESSINLLKGYIHEAVDNRTLAMDSFRAALACDPFCYEAFHALTQHHMLSFHEEKELLASLPISHSWNESEENLIRLVYQTQLNKYSGGRHKDSSNPVMPIVQLESNLDFITAEAENLYYNCDFTSCFKLTQKVLQKDPYHPHCLTIHISCLVELKQSNTLFLLGHKLVDLYPENALAWFAVGCYYYLIGKNDHARRFLSKATTIDRVLGPAWIAYGHSFAAENEHDQARAAYYKAAQLMKGCHLPLLYIGMEYSLTNNPKFAEKFFKQALEIAPSDPFVHHELGVVAYANTDYSTAESFFRKAITVIEESGLSVIPEKWATLIQNLGLTCCKLRKYDESLNYHQNALRVSPGNASTYVAIGIVQTYLGNYEEAIGALHKALSLQKDNSVATCLLQSLMHQAVLQHLAIPDDMEMTFDLIDVETAPGGGVGGTSSSSGPPKNKPPSNETMDDLKNILGSSIGKPSMHSSGIASENVAIETPAKSGSGTPAGDTSVVNIEDMVMDDDSP